MNRSFIICQKNIDLKIKKQKPDKNIYIFLIKI